VNAAGSVQWSQSTDHEFGDLLALQDACCQAILTGLADHAPPAETAVDVAAR
jgi:hypothetical protein